jgi:hypothetical protein
VQGNPFDFCYIIQMLGDLSQLRFVGLQQAPPAVAPMRQVHAMQVGFIDQHQTPDVTIAAALCTLKIARECPCSNHPFAFAISKVITTSLDNETRLRAMKSRCRMLALSADGTRIGYITCGGYEPDINTMHSYPITQDNWRNKIMETGSTVDIKCVVAGPPHILMRDIKEFPYCLHGCTQVHYSYPNHNKMCTRACMVAYKHPSVAQMYAQMYVLDNLSLEKCPDALKFDAKEHMRSFVEQHAGEFALVWVPHDTMAAAMLIRECAWAVQRLIMLGMKDRDCMWSWVPKDVCKLIHRMVFD